jgi:hypothetical protein
MITIGFKSFTRWESQLGHAAGGPAESRPCLVAEAMSDLWDGSPHLEMEAMPSLDGIAAEVVVYADTLEAETPRGTALLYWDYFDRLKRVVGFAPATTQFMDHLLAVDQNQWTLRLGFARDWEELIRGDSDNFEDARGHPARQVGGAVVLMARGEGAL